MQSFIERQIAREFAAHTHTESCDEYCPLDDADFTLVDLDNETIKDRSI